MRSLYLLIFLCIPILSLGQDYIIPLKKTEVVAKSKVQENTINKLQMHFAFDKILGVNIENNDKESYTDIYIGKGYATGEIGDPKLPAIKRLIQVPNGAKVTVNINGYSESEIKLKDYGIVNPLYPNQPSVRKDEDISKLIFHKNGTRYQQDKFEDVPIAEVEVLGILRGTRIALLQINPIKYNPVTGTIIVYNDIDIEVIMEGGSLENELEILAKTYSPYFEPISKSLANSYSKGIYDERPDLTKYPIRMQIVSHRMFEQTLQPFIDWKTQKGFFVDVAYTDEIGGTPDEIKTFVHGVYNNATEENPAPTFLVIVGDVAQVPASATGSHSQKKTDLYYASVDGDYFPEMYYGRLSAENTEHLENIISKILYYEQYQFEDPTYLNNATLIAGVDGTWNPRVGEPTVKYGTANYFNEANGFNTVWGYGVAVDTNNINNSSGYLGCYGNDRISVSLINYTAHCNQGSWSEPYLGNSGVNALTNTNKYPLAIGNCCLSADFGYSSVTVGETWIRAKDKGAVTYIGSSPNSYWFEDFYWAVGAFPISGTNSGYVPSFEESSFGAYDAPFNSKYITASGLVFIGNLAVTEAHIKSYNTHSSPTYYWQAYNVLGDPSLVPFLTEAEENEVTHMEILPIGLGSYTVNAKPGSYVGISKNGELYGAALVGSEGVVDVPIKPIYDAGNVSIVVTRPQTKPYITQVPAAATDGAYIVLIDQSINDSEGNGNHQADYGENFMLNVTLKNVGDTPSQTISARVIGNDQYFTLNTVESILLGNFGVDETNSIITYDDAFSFTLSDEVPNNHKALFILELTDGTEVWVSDLELIASAPEIQMGAIIIDVDGNEVLDPGETASMLIEIKNTGRSQSPVVSAVLSSISTDLVINVETSITVGVLEAGETKTITYSLTANEDVPLETTVEMNLVINAKTYGKEYDFEIMIGKIPNYYMGATQTITTCLGRFFDSGGPDGDYSDNENYTMTFYPVTEGYVLSFDFEYAYIEGTSTNLWDKLYIYDGEDTNSPQFTGSPFSNTDGIDIGTIEATNSKGAITFKFVSDESIVMSGWKANISCKEPIYKTTFIVNNTKNETVEQAKITIDGVEGQLITNVEGEVQIDLFNGEYNFTVHAEGYHNYEANFTVSGRDVNVPINLIIVGVTKDELGQFRIFPNPHSTHLNIEGLAQSKRIEITDIAGAVVRTIELKGQDRITLTTEYINSGLFFITITTNSGEKFIRRIVKN
jgi:hypothetical protein